MTKTALDLTPKEWQAYQPARAQDILKKENTFAAKRKQQAWQLVRQAAKLLQEEFEAGRVVLFGSLAASEGEFTLWSDIDLAAWDIPAYRFYAAVAAVTGLSPDFKIDLIDPDTCRPGLRAAIERDGVDL